MPARETYNVRPNRKYYPDSENVYSLASLALRVYRFWLVGGLRLVWQSCMFDFPGDVFGWVFVCMCVFVLRGC